MSFIHPTLVLLMATMASAEISQVSVAADADRIEMGRSVTLDVEVTDADGGPVTDCMLLPHLNEKRWGAHELTNGDGRARIILPLPNPGVARIVVEAVPRVFHTSWIWTPDPKANPAYLLRRFHLDEEAVEADLRVAVDEQCQLFLNGVEIGHAQSFSHVTDFSDLQSHLRPGENTLTVAAGNEQGPAGFVAQLRLKMAGGEHYLTTDREWESWTEKPAGWPGAVTQTGDPVRVPTRLIDEAMGPWATPEIQSWPGTIPRQRLITGHPLPDDAIVSADLEIEVHRRRIESRSDPDHLVGMQWGSYFFPEMFWWKMAHAVPLMGFYESHNRDVIRQHALWMMDMGIDFIFADWPHHIEPDDEGQQHWSNRPDTANGQIHATQMTLEVHAQLRDEGYPAPRLVIMPFLANGPVNSTETVNGQLKWIYDLFIRNPRFEDLWVIDDGKPLIVLLYNSMTHHSELAGPPIDDTHFTVRYMGAQFQYTKMNDHGYWSWMDGVAEPIVTYRDGVAEVVTPSPAYFALNGWLGDDAVGRRNGTAYIRSFYPALEHRPRYVLLHQWSEYAGQAEGYPYENGMYGDSYSVEFSDDLEPVSLTSAGYRGDNGGWGFLYSNLSQALIEIFRQDPVEDTVMAVYPPDHGDLVTGTELEIGWEVIGKEPTSYTVLLDDRVVVEGIRKSGYNLDLRGLAAGDHVVTLIAEGSATRYRLQRVKEDVRLDRPIPLRVDTPFVYADTR